MANKKKPISKLKASILTELFRANGKSLSAYEIAKLPVGVDEDSKIRAACKEMVADGSLVVKDNKYHINPNYIGLQNLSPELQELLRVNPAIFIEVANLFFSYWVSDKKTSKRNTEKDTKRLNELIEQIAGRVDPEQHDKYFGSLYK